MKKISNFCRKRQILDSRIVLFCLHKQLSNFITNKYKKTDSCTSKKFQIKHLVGYKILSGPFPKLIAYL